MLKLYRLLQKTFDYLWLNWEPETIIEMMRRENIWPQDLDKVLALQTYIMSDAFFVDSFAFEKVVVAHSGRTPDFSLFEDVSPIEICRCIHDLKQVPERDYRDYEDEVLEYILRNLIKHKIYSVPKNIVIKDQLDDARSDMKSYLNSDQKNIKTDAKVLEDIISE